MKIDYAKRLAKLHEIEGVDVIAIAPGTNMVYFTGLHFHLSERPIIALYRPSDESLSFIIPGFEITKLRTDSPIEVRAFGWTDEEGYRGAFRQAVEELGLGGATMGVDGMKMRVFEWLAFQEIDDSVGVKELGQQLLDIRARKTADEVDSIRRAIRIAEGALEAVMAWVQPGMTEREIARKLSDEMSDRGSEGKPFGPLVLTGPKSALPHGNTGDRALGADEYLLIDYGALVGDYPSDITRTFCLGTPTDERRKVYDIVLQANEAAKAIAAPGVATGDVDKAARAVIEAAGYGEYFTHRTGHGLGMDGHELPQIVQGDDTRLEPGMVFTIEPGIYLPQLGGVRIEDNVVVTEDGIEVLTTYPRELLVRR
jgi:Xaa-Pro dipeptidase